MNKTRGRVPLPESVKRPTISEVIAARFRRDIIKGEIKPGDFLPSEIELMKRFQVSRPTVREALRILHSESFLSVASGVRARAQLPDVNVTARYGAMYLQAHGTTFAELHHARAIFEPPIVAELARRPNIDAMAHLRMLISAQKNAEDNSALAEAMASFHEHLVELYDNKTLTLLIRVVHSLVRKYYSSLVDSTTYDDLARKRSIRASLLAQTKLVALIEAGRACEAKSFWREHLTSVSKILDTLGVSKELVHTHHE